MTPPSLSLSLVARHPKAVAENMAKLQEDREFLQSLVSATLEEMGSGGTFCTLSQQLEQCRQKKLAMEETILRLGGQGREWREGGESGERGEGRGISFMGG